MCFGNTITCRACASVTVQYLGISSPCEFARLPEHVVMGHALTFARCRRCERQYARHQARQWNDILRWRDTYVRYFKVHQEYAAGARPHPGTDGVGSTRYVREYRDRLRIHPFPTGIDDTEGWEAIERYVRECRLMGLMDGFRLREFEEGLRRQHEIDHTGRALTEADLHYRPIAIHARAYAASVRALPPANAQNESGR